MPELLADVAKNSSIGLAVLWEDEKGTPFRILQIIIANNADEAKGKAMAAGARLSPCQESASALKRTDGALLGHDDESLYGILRLSHIKPFSLKALKTLKENVPRGRLIGYGALAGLLGKASAARAVGAAMASNPFPVLFPCHRVVGSDGQLNGFGGGLALKRRMLEIEGIRFESSAIGCKAPLKYLM